nr:cytidine deaminase [Xanthovirga aplysinae]
MHGNFSFNPKLLPNKETFLYMTKLIKSNVYLTEHLNSTTLSSESAKLVHEAREACNSAYAPYSGFNVGAAVLLENGEIVKGSNQENAAYPSGLCAERVALFAASAQFPGIKFLQIAIAARKADSTHFIFASPCGSCRQVMNEYEMKFEHPIQIFIQGEGEKIYEAKNVDVFLPFGFNKNHLM